MRTVGFASTSGFGSGEGIGARLGMELEPLEQRRGVAEHRRDAFLHRCRRSSARAPPLPTASSNRRSMRRPTLAVTISMRRPMSRAVSLASRSAARSNVWTDETYQISVTALSGTTDRTRKAMMRRVRRDMADLWAVERWSAVLGAVVAGAARPCPYLCYDIHIWSHGPSAGDCRAPPPRPRREAIRRSRRRLSGPALRTFFNIAAAWQLSVAEQRALLGWPAASTFHKYKAGDHGALSFDTLTRLSLVIGIYRASRCSIPSRRSPTPGSRMPNSHPAVRRPARARR